MSNQLDALFKNGHIVGHITQIDYKKAHILSHDYNVNEAFYIPKNTFLIIKIDKVLNDNQSVSIKEESRRNTKLNQEIKTDTFAAILCRVEDITYINQEAIANKQNSVQKLLQANQSIKQQIDMNDPFTQNHLAFYQLDCKILGSFFLNQQNELTYGSDAFSFSVAHIYEAYKPSKTGLETIVNFIKEDRLKVTQKLLEDISKQKLNQVLATPIGKVRYASTNLILPPNSNNTSQSPVEVQIYPSDFIKQKTGIFGTTRSGKTNTSKMIAKSIHDLSNTIQVPIGQIIYDINGEYANDTNQGKGTKFSNLLFSIDDRVLKNSMTNQNVANKFIPALNNFYVHANYGMNVIQAGIRKQNKDSNYINNFMAIKNIENNVLTHFFWILLLYKSGYPLPQVNINFKNYVAFNAAQKCFVLQLNKPEENEIKNISVLNNQVKSIQGQQCLVLTENFLSTFIKAIETHLATIEGTALYHPDQKTMSSFIAQVDLNSSGKQYSISGWQMITPYRFCHCEYANHKDYREHIYENAKKGETIMIDFSIGDPYTRKYIADELMSYIFEEQINIFRENKPCPIINVFIEEAHNVIGCGAPIDSLWPRIAKEGAKYNIGLIYITQEPSAIHPNILANTANFVVAHLNNDNEVRVVSQYADLGDFAALNKNAEDVGFVRMKLLSKPYTIPVQIDLYQG